MEELEIVLERETNEELEINLLKEGEKVLPPLEDIEITPSTTDKVYKSKDYYGYNEVLVKGVEGATEDLTAELTEQNELITIQKNALLEAISKLQGKTGGGSGTVLIEEYYLEGTKLHIVLSNGQTLIIDIGEYINTEFSVEQIEELIISNLESKTIEEVEK